MGIYGLLSDLAYYESIGADNRAYVLLQAFFRYQGVKHHNI